LGEVYLAVDPYPRDNHRQLVLVVVALAINLLVIYTLYQTLAGKPVAAEEIFPSVQTMKSITPYLVAAKIVFTILLAYFVVQPHIRGTLAYEENKDKVTPMAAGYKLCYGTGHEDAGHDSSNPFAWDQAKLRPFWSVTVFNWMFWVQVIMGVLYVVADLMQSSEAEPEAEEEKPAEAAADAQQTAENADQVTIDVAPENEEAKPIVEDEAVKSEPEAQDEAIVEAVEAVQDEAVVEAVIAQDEAVEADQAQDVAVEAPQEIEAVEAPVEAQAEQVADVAAPEPEAEIEAPVAEEAPVAVEAPVEAPVEEAVEDVREAPVVSADNIHFDDAADLPAPEVFPQVDE